MIKLRLIVKYYMLSFLLIDALSGFIRVYLGITNPIFNVGYWIRGPILIMFIFYYLMKVIKKDLYFDEITEYSAVRQDLQSLSSLRSDSLLKVKTYFNSPANRFHKRYKNLPSSTTIADIYARPPRG